MKKITLGFFATLIITHSVWAENTLPAELANVDNVNSEMNFTASENESVALSKTMKIAAETQHEADQNAKYSVELHYPQIQGTELSNEAKLFNTEIMRLVSEEVDQFKKNLALDKAHMKTLPENARQNSLKMDYDIDVIKPKSGTVVSVRLSVEGMQAGRAHPYHNNRVVNFNLTTGKALSLNELFKKDSKFLQRLAEYSNKSLTHKLKSDNWMIAQGTKADEKNFKNWNLQADSILITFDEYQVAPYVYGKQEVEVPYSELKKILSSKAPISACAQDVANCQVG